MSDRRWLFGAAVFAAWTTGVSGCETARTEPPSRTAQRLIEPVAHDGALFEWAGVPVEVAPGTSQLAIRLESFDDFPRTGGIHAGAPFALAQLDEDPRAEILVKSYRAGQPGCGPTLLFAYDDDGSLLWSRSLGENACAYGSWSPVIAFDLDHDGVDEIYAYHWPTGEPCRLAQIDVSNGSVVRAVAWPGADVLQPKSLHWRASLLIAYLEPDRPSVIAITGYERRGTGHFVAAFDASLNETRTFRSDETSFLHQGAHQYIAGDLVGDDGRDEILFGNWYLDSELQVAAARSLPGHNHADGLQMSDFDPTRPGIEIWLGSDRGLHVGMLDDRLEWIWQAPIAQQAQGAYGDLDPSVPGWESAFDCCGGHDEPPLTTRRIRYADGREATFSSLGLDELDVEHHNLQSDFPHWNPDHSVRLLESIPGLMASLDNPVLFRIKGDFFGDGREEVIVLDGDVLRVFAATAPVLPRPSGFRDDRKYRMELARGSRHFSAFHYTAPLPLRFLPTSSLETLGDLDGGSTDGGTDGGDDPETEAGPDADHGGIDPDSPDASDPVSADVDEKSPCDRSHDEVREADS